MNDRWLERMAAADVTGSFRRFGSIAVVITILVAVTIGWSLLTVQNQDALVVYCAHDLLYAEEILRDFEQQTGISIVIVGDTEATKSLGLVQRLIREKDAPQCDVFWNNQMLGTVELARQGVLEPYQGPGWAGMPDRFRDGEGLWVGFGGRLRVWIVNTENPMTIDLSSIGTPTSASLNQLAIAEPMFGTTLSHYAVLWDQLGADGLKAWHRGLVASGVRFVPGNATVKDLVAGGVCSLGMTDTDDYFQAVDAGSPVTMSPIAPAPGATICIPNTVAIIRRTDKRQAAEALVDFLSSPAAELHMARSRSRQIPLGTGVDPAEMPADVQPLAEAARRSVELKHLAQARADCLDWLAREFAP